MHDLYCPYGLPKGHPLLNLCLVKEIFKKEHKAEGIRPRQVCSFTKFSPIFHDVSLSVSSLVLVELKGRGCKKRGLGKELQRLVRSLKPRQRCWECRGVMGWGKPRAESPFLCMWLCGWSPGSGKLKPAIEELFDLRQRAVLDFLLRKECK